MAIPAVQGDEGVELHRVDRLPLIETIATSSGTLRIEHWKRDFWDKVNGIEHNPICSHEHEKAFGLGKI